MNSNPKYPTRLLPRKSYKLIDSNDLKTGDYYLIRNFLNSSVKEAGALSDEDIAKPREQIISYSVNLVGVFKPSDGNYQILKEFDFYNDDWEIGTNSARPSINQFIINSDLDIVWFEFNEVNNFPFKGVNNNVNLQYNFCCRAEHKPTKCNFWHFELNWFNIDKDYEKIIKDKTKPRGGISHGAIALMRSQFKQIAQYKTPNKPYSTLSNNYFEI